MSEQKSREKWSVVGFGILESSIFFFCWIDDFVLACFCSNDLFALMESRIPYSRNVLAELTRSDESVIVRVVNDIYTHIYIYNNWAFHDSIRRLGFSWFLDLW